MIPSYCCFQTPKGISFPGAVRCRIGAKTPWCEWRACVETRGFFFRGAIIAGWLKDVSNMTFIYFYFPIYGIIPTPLTFFLVKTANQKKNAFEQSEQNLIHDDSWFTQIWYLCWCFDKTSLFQGFLRIPNWNLGMVIGLTMLSTWFFWTLWSSHSCGWFF